jgi:twitching motility two-component system response regulator PilH
MLETRTVMIAARDARMRQNLRWILRDEAGQFLEAASGLGALMLARRERPEILLLSTGLPRLDGYAVCRRLKEDPDTANMVVVMVAGEAEIGVAERASRVGADGYLVQPSDPSRLVRRSLLLGDFLAQEPCLTPVGSSAARSTGDWRPR